MLAFWESSVSGTDEGDGWLQCEVDQERMAVLVQEAAAEKGAASPKVEGGKVPDYVQVGSTEQIQRGIVLRSLPGETPPILSGPVSPDEIGRVADGGLVRASGPAVNINGQWMVPIEPAGAVHLARFGIA